MKKTKVMIAEDHPLMREAIRSRLGEAMDIEVVGEVDNGEDLLPTVQKLNPDVLILDVSMPRFNALMAARKLKKDHPQVKILVLTAHDEEELVVGLVSAGIKGYLLKDDCYSLNMVSAVRLLADGQSYLSQRVAARLASRIAVIESKALTEREIAILQLAARGLTPAEMADGLHLATQTVYNHLANIYKKFDVKNLTGAVIHALKEGVISID
jgi:NarL family two-component system response regulator LiaR